MMEAQKDWPAILQFGTGDTITESEVEKRYRQVAKRAHPDAGGSNEAMTQVNLAKQLALAWIAKERERVVAQESAEKQSQILSQYYSSAAQQQQWPDMANSFGGLGNYAASHGYQESAKATQSKADWVRSFFRGKA